MKNDVTKHLKKFRYIEPESDFQARSRELILGTRQNFSLSFALRNPIAMGAFAAAGAFAIFFAMVLMTQTGVEPKLSSLDSAVELGEEFNDLTISIELKEISYQTTANQTIAAAIDEIIDEKARHLNRGILEEEQSLLNDMDSENERDVDMLLNQVIF